MGYSDIYSVTLRVTILANSRKDAICEAASRVAPGESTDPRSTVVLDARAQLHRGRTTDRQRSRLWEDEDSGFI